MSRYIPDDVLDQIRLRADIVDVVQSYVPTLKRAGQTWKACCPFHHEKTPSFIVNPSRGIFKCFGCGKGGNAFTFVMEMERLDFPDAAEMLARKYGVIIPEEPRGNSARDGRRAGPDRNTRERLFTLHEELAAFYRNQLSAHPDSAVARYFATREIPGDVAAQFMIGASPDSWDAAIRFAQARGFSDEELRTSGIVSSPEENPNRIYDRFRNRLMFPIWNEQGRVVGFSARSVEANPRGAKYVNTPETPIFTKGRILYALNFARPHIHEKDSIVLCEGQMDAIALHRAGVRNAVAPQGTAFTPEQANILKRHSTNVVLALDNDQAGWNAVFKDAEILLPLGFAVRVAVYPGAKDADELLKKSGPEALRNAVDASIDFFDFALRNAMRHVDPQSPAGKAAAANKVVDWLLQLDNDVTRAFYMEWLAKELALPESAIASVVERRRIDGARFRNPHRIVETPKPTVRPKAADRALAELLALSLADEEVARVVANDLPHEAIGSSPTGRALELVIASTLNGEWADAADSMMLELAKSGADASEVSGILASAPDSASLSERAKRNACNGALRILLELHGKEERAKLILAGGRELDDAKKAEISVRIAEITKELLALRKKYPVIP